MSAWPTEISSSEYASNQRRRVTVLPNRFEDPVARQQRLQRTGQGDVWSQAPSSLSNSPAGPTGSERASSSYSPFAPQAQWSREDLVNQAGAGFPDPTPSATWPISPLASQYPNQTSISPVQGMGSRYAHSNWTGAYPAAPAPLLRRTSSDDARLSQYSQPYYGDEGSPRVGSFPSKTYPQRRPSNRDEFDGPSQLLDKPEDNGYEPKEEDMPKLPVTLYAQEQDDILSKVNDRLAKCAFDFVAKYQFPIPIEPDKRPVRVPSDREWSEWVYLLKRLATKRRIPARVLYNGQIKQLITILENSLEMRHAAKHQSRPLKDDRNILQLISSGLQVAKIVKDAPAMQYLDALYQQTERLIRGRQAAAAAQYGSMCIM